MILKIFMILALTVTSLAATAKAKIKPKAKSKTKTSATKTEASTPAKEVNEVLAAYRSALAIRAGIKKTVVQEAMGTETIGEGQFYFSKGKLRMDLVTPEKTILVYDGLTVWFESRIESADGKGETVQVTKMKTNKLKRTDSLMATLFEEKDISKTFKFVGSKPVKVDKDGVKVFDFKPIKKDSTEVQFLQIGIKGGNIEHITYRDQVENVVKFEFTNMIKGAIVAEKFKYTPPKNAEITEI